MIPGSIIIYKGILAFSLLLKPELILSLFPELPFTISVILPFLSGLSAVSLAQKKFISFAAFNI